MDGWGDLWQGQGHGKEGKVCMHVASLSPQRYSVLSCGLSGMYLDSPHFIKRLIVARPVVPPHSILLCYSSAGTRT